MEREDILRALRAHHDNCICAFYWRIPGSSGQAQRQVLVCHSSGFIAEETVLHPAVFPEVKDALTITSRWGNERSGGCTWRLRPEYAVSPEDDISSPG